MFKEGKFLFTKLQPTVEGKTECPHFAILSEVIDLGYDYHELLSIQKRQPDIVCLLMDVHTTNHEEFLPKTEPESSQPLHASTKLLEIHRTTKYTEMHWQTRSSTGQTNAVFNK